MFFLAGPTKQQQAKLDVCFSCEQTELKGKEVVHCQFCGNPCCQPCMVKERNFPKAKLDDSGKKPRGKICAVCDHKFLIRQLVLEDNFALQKSRQQSKSLEEKLQLLKRE